MGKVLTDGTTLKCAASVAAPATHGGTLATTGTARLRVDGHKVLTGPNVQAAVITGCGDTTLPQVPCVGLKVNSVTGVATKLKVDGQPVVLDGVGGQTTGNPIGTIRATAGMSGRLQAI